MGNKPISLKQKPQDSNPQDSNPPQNISLDPNKEYQIIFIDIDGVLNNAESTVTQLYVIEDDLTKLLKHLVDQIEGSILILSSTWRYTQLTREKVKTAFENNGVPCYVSCTPNLQINRVIEILVWLRENTNYFDNDKVFLDKFKDISFDTSRFKDEFPLDCMKLKEIIKAKNFVAIDDENLMKDEQLALYMQNHFVFVNKKTGLTAENVEKAIKLLNS